MRLFCVEKHQAAYVEPHALGSTAEGSYMEPHALGSTAEGARKGPYPAPLHPRPYFADGWSGNPFILLFYRSGIGKVCDIQDMGHGLFEIVETFVTGTAWRKWPAVLQDG